MWDKEPKKRQALKMFRDTFCMVFCGHYCTHKECRDCRVKWMTIHDWDQVLMADFLEVKHAE